MNQELGKTTVVAPNGIEEETEEEKGEGAEIIDLAERTAQTGEAARLQQNLTRLLVKGVVPETQEKTQ